MERQPGGKACKAVRGTGETRVVQVASGQMLQTGSVHWTGNCAATENTLKGGTNIEAILFFLSSN